METKTLIHCILELEHEKKKKSQLDPVVVNQEYSIHQSITFKIYQARTYSNRQVDGFELS
ncbi:hypothetical protein IC582_007011 [Cucumis melo]